MIGGLSMLILLVVAILLLAPSEAGIQGISVSRTKVEWMPRFNAVLNMASAFLLSAAYISIRRRQIKRHRIFMLSAFGLSALFLVSYVIYHALSGSTQFAGPAWIRSIYFTILISHITLAAIVLPLSMTTLYRAWQGTFPKHRRIARWTLPIWLYVSVSGVAVYLILYHL